MRKVFATFIAIIAVILNGCGRDQLISAIAPKEEAAIGQRYLDDVRTRNFQPVEDALNPIYKTSNLPIAMEKLASIYFQETPKNVKLIGSNVGYFNGQTTYNLTYEYEFPHGWTLAHILLIRIGTRLQIERLDVYPLKDSLEKTYAFSLANKSLANYVILALAILLPVFSLVSAVTCYRTPIPKRKWLWIIFVLLGFGGVTLNWTTGAVGLNPISFTFLCAMYSQQFYGPIILQIAIPLGAIVFWTRRSRWIADANKIN